MERVKEIMRKDIVADVETTLGKSTSEMNHKDHMFMVSEVIKHGREKETLLKELNDSFMGISYDDYLTLVKSLGFEQVLCDEFVDSESNNRVEEFSLYVHKEKFLVMRIESYYGKTRINSTNVYGCGKFKDEWFPNCSHGPLAQEFVDFDFDARENLRGQLKEFDENCEYTDWSTVKDRFLWFVNFSETKDDGYDYKAISKTRIDRCPEIQKIMYGEVK